MMVWRNSTEILGRLRGSPHCPPWRTSPASPRPSPGFPTVLPTPLLGRSPPTSPGSTLLPGVPHRPPHAPPWRSPPSSPRCSTGCCLLPPPSFQVLDKRWNSTENAWETQVVGSRCGQWVGTYGSGCVQDFPHFSPLDIFLEKKPFDASVFYATPEVPV